MNTIEVFIVFLLLFKFSLLRFLILLSLKLEFVSLLYDKYFPLSGNSLQYPYICLHLTSNFLINASNKFVKPNDKARLYLITLSID